MVNPINTNKTNNQLSSHVSTCLYDKLLNYQKDTKINKTIDPPRRTYTIK
jgi:hypothetical protein